ncbi:MAG: TRAP transporter large permease subunit [Motiliproteus sp.]
MIVDDVSGGVLAAIILLPVIQKIGVDPVHFASIVGTNLGLGNISPPCAPLLYMAGVGVQITAQSLYRSDHEVPAAGASADGVHRHLYPGAESVPTQSVGLINRRGVAADGGTLHL